jgi:hypothetical protein
MTHCPRSLVLSSPNQYSPKQGREEILTAAVDEAIIITRYLSCLTRGVTGLSFTARIERPPFHRGGSASKKDGLATPLPFPPCAFHE